MSNVDDAVLAEAIIAIVGDSKWEGVAAARGLLALRRGASHDVAAREMYEAGPHSLKANVKAAEKLAAEGLRSVLTPREKIGSAENPVTKLIPATVTEERFTELLDDLCERRSGLIYQDERESGNKLIDFTIVEGDRELPINVKNAGTLFEKAKELVGIDPEDCIPIPAYKAHSAVERVPELLYVISIDYTLVGTLGEQLPTLFTAQERLVWSLLSDYAGTQCRSAENAFIFKVIRRHWSSIKPVIANNPFNTISARKAITILHNDPKRTPGIGLRAWGTGANAEVNVHVSVSGDATSWVTVAERIVKNGVEDIIRAVNRRIMREVPAPEI